MSNFCKNEDCPPSQILLDYQNGDIELHEAREIGRHLAVCEFCEAEVDFYAQYPQPDEVVKAERIPRPLFELAEALLKDKRDSSPFYDLIKGGM